MNVSQPDGWHNLVCIFILLVLSIVFFMSLVLSLVHFILILALLTLIQLMSILLLVVYFVCFFIGSTPFRFYTFYIPIFSCPIFFDFSYSYLFLDLSKFRILLTLFFIRLYVSFILLYVFIYFYIFSYFHRFR